MVTERQTHNLAARRHCTAVTVQMLYCGGQRIENKDLSSYNIREQFKSPRRLQSQAVLMLRTRDGNWTGSWGRSPKAAAPVPLALWSHQERALVSQLLVNECPCLEAIRKGMAGDQSRH